jgi:hypothetical protein
MASQHSAAPLPRLDLWLAAAMGMDPALRRFLVRSGVNHRAVAAVRSAAGAVGISERSLTTPAQIVEFFGAPVSVRADRLVYDSVLWPAHQFIWAVSRWGDAGPLGFRLREPVAPAPLRVDADLEQLRAHLRAWHHTEHEVRCVLGAADRTIGYPHSSRWLYVTPPGPLCLQFAFGWGLLRDISTRPLPADMLVRGGPWSPRRVRRAPFPWLGTPSRRF